jgi:hypothetical protein
MESIFYESSEVAENGSGQVGSESNQSNILFSQSLSLEDDAEE